MDPDDDDIIWKWKRDQVQKLVGRRESSFLEMGELPLRLIQQFSGREEIKGTGGPAFSPEVKGWYLNGQLHREHGPAVVHPNGTREWYVNGQLHREHGPALEFSEDTQWLCSGSTTITMGAKHEWRIDGVKHREDGPAVVFTSGDQGYEEWWRHGVLHRDDAPAIVHANGAHEYYFLGKKHRDHGPAVVYPNGHGEWWKHGQKQPEPPSEAKMK